MPIEILSAPIKRNEGGGGGGLGGGGGREGVDERGGRK